MKNVYKLFTLTLMTFAVTVCGFSQISGKPLTTPTQNLVRGVIGPAGSNSNWANYTIFNLVPGSALYPLTSTSTVFYYGFTAGTQADIGNMVVYTTARGSLTVTAVTPVTLGGISNPSILLNSPTVCPVAPSATTPCIVRFDPTTLTLTPSSDYYFAVYFTSNANNTSVAGTNPSANQSSLSGTYTSADTTHIAVGGSIPSTANRTPYFLMYVMNN